MWVCEHEACAVHQRRQSAYSPRRSGQLLHLGNLEADIGFFIRGVSPTKIDEVMCLQQLLIYERRAERPPKAIRIRTLCAEKASSSRSSSSIRQKGYMCNLSRTVFELTLAES